ncbi:MAG: ABC transporter substrate-binding protein [Deltaproteobacteria bacterium]|nr:ABC transporter substrate-binding protein [Deltaproteobacteria bacterium]
MKLTRTLALLLLIGLLVPGMAGAADTVKIGLLAPLTGFAAADGLSVLNSVQLAVERVNQDGGLLGRQVELVYYDDRADGKEAVALSRKLIQQDRVAGVVGGSYSTPSRAVAPIFEDEEIPFVAAYAVHPDVTTSGKYCFRNGFLGMVEGKSAGYVSVELLKAKKIALLTSDNDFGRTLAEGFKAYLGDQGKDAQIVFEQTYPFKEKDFKPYLSKVKEANPDILFASGYYFQTGPIVQQARELGLDIQILGEEGADSPKFLEIAGASAEGFVIVTNLDRDDPRPVVQDFLKTFEQRYQIQPDMVGASAYDAFMIICDGIRRAGTTDGPAIQQAIAATKDYNGLTGVLKGFNDIGEVVKEVQVQIVKDGRFRHFGVVQDMALITP